jgi:hypothetical protein
LLLVALVMPAGNLRLVASAAAPATWAFAARAAFTEASTALECRLGAVRMSSAFFRSRAAAVACAAAFSASLSTVGASNVS